MHKLFTEIKINVGITNKLRRNVFQIEYNDNNFRDASAKSSNIKFLIYDTHTTSFFGSRIRDI